MERNNHGSSDIENPHTPLKNPIKKELERLPLLSSACSIGRVPRRMRLAKQEAYTPRVVSIGPLHHDREGLKAMEEHKKRYLNDFLLQTNESLESYIEVVKQKEEKLRDFYAEAIQFNGDEFVKITLVDATFIIMVILKLNSLQPVDENDRGILKLATLIRIEKNDPLFHKPWLLEDILPDLLLLENQVPFFILEDLFYHSNDLASSLQGERPSFIMLSHALLRFLNFGGATNPQEISSSEVAHFVDLMRLLFLPTKLPKQPKEPVQSDFALSITELHRAGVKFRVASSENLFDLQFSKKEGFLKIPQLRVEKWTELAFRNMVAFEQCFCDSFYITSYVFTLDRLVNSKEDVDMLIKNKIVQNFKGDSHEVACLFNKLPDGTRLPLDFYFASLLEDMDDYCSTPWHNWKANLKQKYFNTPWATISFMAGVALLILTLIQTVCSLISAISPKNQH